MFFLPKVKYAIIKGVQVNDRAVMTLITIDSSYDSKYTIKCTRTGKEFYKSSIYKNLYSFKQLMKWGRLLASSRTKPLYWTVLEKRGAEWHSLKENN